MARCAFAKNPIRDHETDCAVDNPNVHVLKDGHAVSRIADWIMYSVEAEFIDKVVEEYGPCMSIYVNCLSTNLTNFPTATRVGAIVAGQTSVKAPERAAFEKHLPEDVSIISVHSLHGPTVSTVGQPLVRPNLLLRLLPLTPYLRS